MPASEILNGTLSRVTEGTAEHSGLQPEFILIFNATDGKISGLMS